MGGIDMEYRKLGNSGLKVSELGLGANNFGWWIDEKRSKEVIYHAIDRGINFIDTADMYDRGTSEEIIGKALKGKRHNIIIATKFSSKMGDGPNDHGGSRYYIMKAIEASLRRLQTDYIDLYQMHNPDPETPIEETLRALNDLIQEGKVRYIGCSNFSAWQLTDALWTSRINNLNPFITIQTKYNLFERQIEQEIVPCCQAHGIGIIPWGPLAGGFLTGKYHPNEEPSKTTSSKMPPKAFLHLYKNNITEKNWERLSRLELFSKERGRKLSELAIAWLLSHSYISTVIAGATSPEQIDSNISAITWKLSKEDISQIEQI